MCIADDVNSWKKFPINGGVFFSLNIFERYTVLHCVNALVICCRDTRRTMRRKYLVSVLIRFCWRPKKKLTRVENGQNQRNHHFMEVFDHSVGEQKNSIMLHYYRLSVAADWVALGALANLHLSHLSIEVRNSNWASRSLRTKPLPFRIINGPL